MIFIYGVSAQRRAFFWLNLPHPVQETHTPGITWFFLWPTREVSNLDLCLLKSLCPKKSSSRNSSLPSRSNWWRWSGWRKTALLRPLILLWGDIQSLRKINDLIIDGIKYFNIIINYPQFITDIGWWSPNIGSFLAMNYWANSIQESSCHMINYKSGYVIYLLVNSYFSAIYIYDT